MFGRVAEAVATVAASRSATNVAWNLLGGLWAGVLVVLATPWYVARLGLEGYGIVGVWLVLQGTMGLLDLGMGATVVRAFAAASTDRDGHAYRRDILRTLELLYWGAALALAIVLFVCSNWIGRHWLESSAIAPGTLVSALRVMAVALGMQFPVSLYSYGLLGTQEHGRMNALQISGNTLRYGGGAAVLLWRPEVLWFFGIQAFVAAVQTLVTRKVLRDRLSVGIDGTAVVRFALLKPLWGYSAGMAVSSFAAVLMSNADRIALSALSTTTELGKYSVAFTASGLLQLGIQPFYRSFFPRYSELVASGEGDRLRREYFRSCQLMAVLIVPMGVIGWVFAPELIGVWLGSGDPTVIGVFRWLLIGITCAGLMWLPAAFQQAHGWTQLHASMIGGALVVGGPLMIWAIGSVGTIGATTVWVLHGTSCLTLGLWLMHRRLLPGQLAAWYRVVLLPPLIVSIPTSVLSRWILPGSMGRWLTLAWVGSTGLVVIVALLSPIFGGAARAAAPSADARGN